jgi:hypothetical protein
MTVLADYRSDVHDIVATYTDAGKWPPTLIDAALRLALVQLNQQLVYEADFTVTGAGYEQDLSGITAINSILDVAYPWVEGSDFGRCVVPWRLTGPNTIYLTHAQPAVDDVIRVRYSKLHAIEDLDGAEATTVPEAQRYLVGLWAAAYGCEMRLRQAGELYLGEVATRLREQGERVLSHVPVVSRLRWGSVGLE